MLLNGRNKEVFGSIIGDIVGSRLEFHNIKTKEFELFNEKCHFTDDSVLTLAIACALLDSNPDHSNLSKKTIGYMRKLGREVYPSRNYGGMFKQWLLSQDPQPYNSWSNGAAMRVSPCGFWGKDLNEVKLLSHLVTGITHNHPEGMKGAEATAVAIYLARTGKKIPEIKEYICENYYKIDFTLDEIRSTYSFRPSCIETIPQAMEAFFESTNYEDAIRNAMSIGGDSDTIGAITGGIAEAYYGIPQEIKEKALSYLDENFKKVLKMAYQKIGKQDDFP